MKNINHPRLEHRGERARRTYVLRINKQGLFGKRQTGAAVVRSKYTSPLCVLSFGLNSIMAILHQNVAEEDPLKSELDAFGPVPEELDANEVATAMRGAHCRTLRAVDAISGISHVDDGFLKRQIRYVGLCPLENLRDVKQFFLWLQNLTITAIDCGSGHGDMAPQGPTRMSRAMLLYSLQRMFVEQFCAPSSTEINGLVRFVAVTARTCCRPPVVLSRLVLPDNVTSLLAATDVNLQQLRQRVCCLFLSRVACYLDSPSNKRGNVEQFVQHLLWELLLSHVLLPPLDFVSCVPRGIPLKEIDAVSTRRKDIQAFLG